MAKYGVFISPDEYGIAVMKTTVASPTNADWDAQDGGKRNLLARFGQSKIKSLWAYEDNHRAYDFDASDAGPNDPGAVWSTDGNAFDGDDATSANVATSG